MTTISKNMKLSDLRAMSAFSACTEPQLKVVRTCLVLAQDGVDLRAVSSGDLEMVRAHAVTSQSGAGRPDVDATFARSGVQFLHLNRRTAEWSFGSSTPPLASDGKRGGWIYFQIKEKSAEKAKGLAERYIQSPGAIFTGGIVCLSNSVAYLQERTINF